MLSHATGVLMLGPGQHRWRSMTLQRSRICCSGLPSRHRKHVTIINSVKVSHQSTAKALNGLLLLACLHDRQNGDSSSTSGSRTREGAQNIYDDATMAVRDAFQQHVVGVVLTNALLAWSAMRKSGIADMKLPLRYVVDCEGHKLDCAFEVPLIGENGGNDRAGITVAKMAALQVFHIWFTKSWDRMLCWYNKLVELESTHGRHAGRQSLISSEKKEALQMDIDRRMFAGEAFTVPLEVVMEVATALLGEAEVLAVVVACEEAPHHYGKPGRLAQGSREDDFVSARLHRHAGLRARRHRLQPISSHKTSQAALRKAVRAWLFFAMIRRGLQMELLESTPPGLELMSVSGSSHSAMTVSLAGDRLECDIVLPQPVLMPLFDELLSSYDHFRLALWPAADAALQRLQVPGQPPVAAGPRRAAEARETLVDIVPVLQQVVVDLVLQQLRPSMLVNWRLHLAETQRSRQSVAGAGEGGETVDAGDSGPGVPPQPAATSNGASTPALASPGNGALGGSSAGVGSDGPCKTGQPHRHAWAALMPRLSNLELPCADAVCIQQERPSARFGRTQPLPLSVPEHLQPHSTSDASATAAQLNWQVGRDDVVRMLYGVELPQLLPAQEPHQGEALHSMPSRRATRDFYARKDVQAAVSSRSCSVPGWGGMPVSSAAASWQRLLLLPPQTEACTWEALLSRPADTAMCAFHGGSIAARSDGVLRITNSLQQLQRQEAGGLAADQQWANGAGREGHSAWRAADADQQSTACDVDAVRESWATLERGTDASGVHMVRTAWIAALGRLQTVSAAAPEAKQGAGAPGELQAALHGLQASQQRARAQPQWGDHAAVRERVHTESARASAIEGAADPHPGSMGVLGTPRWLQQTSPRACPAGEQPSGSNYSLGMVHEAECSKQHGAGMGDGQQAAIAHAWTRMLQGAAVWDTQSGACGSAPAATGSGLEPEGVWAALLREHGPLWTSVARMLQGGPLASEPAPLAACRLAPKAHAAWDGLLSGAAAAVEVPQSRIDLVARLPPLLGAARAPAAAQHVWELMVTNEVLLGVRTRRCWRVLGDVYAVTPTDAHMYVHASRVVQAEGLQWRAAGIKGAWGALSGPSAGLRSQGGELRSLGGSRFGVRRSRPAAIASASLDEEAAVSTPHSSRKGRNASDAGLHDEEGMRRHSNRIAAAAAAELHARAARFDQEWARWDERWVPAGASTRQRAPAARSGSAPKEYVSVFSYVPADVEAARCKLAAVRDELTQAVAHRKQVSRRFVAGMQETRRMAYTVESSGSRGRSAWHDLVTLAELLLMHSSMHAEVSSSAWFPSDDFLVQFQQHRSGGLTFRRPQVDAHGEAAEVSIPSAQPVVLCLQAVLFPLQPGMTLTHKPAPTQAAVPCSHVATALRTAAAALAVAVPAAGAVVFAAQSRGGHLPWTSRLPGQPAVATAVVPGVDQPPPRTADDSPAAQQEELHSTAPRTAQQVPLRQQVAFAKDVAAQLRGQVWHGLRQGPAAGQDSADPAVFYVTAAEDGQVVDIVALSAPARRLLPQLPISDAIFTQRSAARLQEWRAEDCTPAVRRFKNGVAVAPQLRVTPRRRPVVQPAQPSLLEVTVYPDALETTAPYRHAGLLERTAGAVRGLGDRLTASVRGVAREPYAPMQPPQRTFQASTVVAVPVDAEAARIVRAVFEASPLDYGHYTIGDLRPLGTNTAAKCSTCSEVIARSTVDGIRVVQDRFGGARTSLRHRMAEYERLIKLSEHDPRAREGAETRLLRVCQAHTNRYLQTFQHAALPATLREECVIAPTAAQDRLWEAITGVQEHDGGTAPVESLLDVVLAQRSDFNQREHAAE
eukprot:jgi/Ulvmu1/4780/UM020_0065.1